MYGSNSALSIDAGVTLAAPNFYLLLGHRVAAIGDVNADGFTDVAASAQEGYAEWYGDWDGSLWVFDGASIRMGAPLPHLASVVVQIDPLGSGMKPALAGAGDINGDGFADTLLGVPDDGRWSQGAHPWSHRTRARARARGARLLGS